MDLVHGINFLEQNWEALMTNDEMRALVNSSFDNIFDQYSKLQNQFDNVFECLINECQNEESFNQISKKVEFSAQKIENEHEKINDLNNSVKNLLSTENDEQKVTYQQLKYIERVEKLFNELIPFMKNINFDKIVLNEYQIKKTVDYFEFFCEIFTDLQEALPYETELYQYNFGIFFRRLNKLFKQQIFEGIFDNKTKYYFDNLKKYMKRSASVWNCFKDDVIKKAAKYSISMILSNSKNQSQSFKALKKHLVNSHQEFDFYHQEVQKILRDSNEYKDLTFYSECQNDWPFALKILYFVWSFPLNQRIVFELEKLFNHEKNISFQFYEQLLKLFQEILENNTPQKQNNDPIFWCFLYRMSCWYFITTPNDMENTHDRIQIISILIDISRRKSKELFSNFFEPKRSFIPFSFFTKSLKEQFLNLISSIKNNIKEVKNYRKILNFYQQNLAPLSLPIYLMYHYNTKTINNDTSANNNNLNTKSHHHNSKTQRTLNQFKEYIFNNEWFSTFNIKIVCEFTSWEKITEWNLSEHYMLAFLINMLFLFGHESEFVSLISSSLERIIRKSTIFGILN